MIDPAVAERYCRGVLPCVSRTFALSVRVLPGTLGTAVLTAYLVCRIADTVEDAPGMPAREKAELLDALVRALSDPGEGHAYARTAAAVQGDPAHVDLVRHADHVFALYHSLPDATRAHVARWVEEMARGMRKFVLLYPDGIRIQTLDEYREYCYYVAGTVGYMLTDLWHEHTPSIRPALHQKLRERCRAFAEALQTVNILKDVAQDAERENSIYVPENSLRVHGSSHETILSPAHVSRNREALGELIRLAWVDLEEALGYLLLVPRRAFRIRLFCILPLLFAFATMRELTRTTAMLVSGGHVKISRREVKTLLFLGPIIAPSNNAVRWVVERVRG
jgi:farnesyl-diphosphate farnesyltransferase